MNWAEFALSLLTACVGSLGGLGGAILLVPLLVITGTPPRSAAPLGLVSVASGSLAAAERHLREQTVNHRLGVATELIASTGAVVGAIASGLAGDRLLTVVLAAVALAAALLGGRRKGIRNLPDPRLGPEDIGEHVGTLAGVYPLGDGYVPYRAERLAVASTLFASAGLLAGLAGASGGFIKTPTTSEVMKVPVRVAAATTTFTVGVTAAAGLLVYALQGRVDARAAATVCCGSLIGGRLGASIQSRLSPVGVRRVVSVLLVVVAVALTAKAVKQ
jgi:hypothetical protein